MDSEKTIACIHVRPHVWRVDKAPGHTHIHVNQNACLKVLRLSLGKICACTYGIRSELVKEIYLHFMSVNKYSYCLCLQHEYPTDHIVWKHCFYYLDKDVIHVDGYHFDLIFF